MKKFIIPIICFVVIATTVFNVDPITNFLSRLISNNPILTITKGNAYTKDYDFMYVQNSEDYIPYSFNDILNIYYSILNQGWSEFTFYCPKEYTECINDVKIISDKDSPYLKHINNFVHPYNSFEKTYTTIAQDGEITVKVGSYRYTEEQITKVNEYVDKVIKELYKNDDDLDVNLKRIHDYIINNTKYDVDRNEGKVSKYTSYNAYGPAIEGYATCNGYADLMAIILSKLNIENFRVATTSDEISYKSNGHIWNAVKIEDKWLHLDLTWDDPVGSDGKDYLHHKYFLVTNEEMKKSDSGNVKVEEHNFNKSIYREFFEEKNATN